MPIPQKITKYLEKAKVKYEPVKHKTVYTARDKAATLRVPEKIVGKVLVVKFNGSFSLVLVPANKNLDKRKFLKVVNDWLKKEKQKSVKLINFGTEKWMKKNLKGVKIGAIPPFGKIWGLPTFVDRGLMRNPKIIVSVGDYNWSIKISKDNLRKLMPDLITGSFEKAKK